MGPMVLWVAGLGQRSPEPQRPERISLTGESLWTFCVPPHQAPEDKMPESRGGLLAVGSVSKHKEVAKEVMMDLCVGSDLCRASCR